MYLKRLELQGFKSFAPRTTLEFSPGITAIVGPNGSGKSNLADGIRWVLGEQSMRQLRGKKSDDIIFAGGQGRAPTQMAEVMLTLDNTAGWLPSERGEVAAARRSFRSGENEYVISGQRVRLRDLLLLLAQARIGHDSYTVIGQGLVDQALSLRAEERRGLFEDAAGIRQFQAQRADAEQKLALTQTNLARLRDILGEIEPRLGPLAEQARRARDYLGTREELRKRLHAWYRWQWADMEGAGTRASAAEAETAARIETIRAGLRDDDTQLQATRERREELVTQIAALRRMRGEASGRAQKLERDLAVGEERRASLDRQSAELDGEQDTQEAALAAARQEFAVLEAQLDAADEQGGLLAREAESAESTQHHARRDQEREEARLRAAQREVMQAQAQLGATQAELARLRKQHAERTQALATRQQEADTARQRHVAAQMTRVERENAFEEARVGVAALADRRQALERAIAAGQAEVETARSALADGERERRALADRRALLAEWQQSLDGYSDGTRAILQAPAGERPPVRGALARLIAVQEGYEAAIEGALGAWLQALVVDAAEEARACARWLREREEGHAMLLWPATDSTTQDGMHNNWLADVDAGDAVLGPAHRFVETEPALRPVIERLLHGMFVVRDLDTFAHLVETNSTSLERRGPRALVTLTGEVLHRDAWRRGGAARPASAGSTGSTGTTAKDEALATTSRAGTLLGRERELRELPELIARQEATIAEAARALDQAARDQSARQAELAECGQRGREAEAHAQGVAREVTALQRDEERARGEQQVCETMAAALAGELGALEQEVTTTALRAAEQEAHQREAQELASEMQEAVDVVAAQSREQQEALARQRTALAVHQQESKALAQRLEQVRQHAAEVEHQVGRRGERMLAIEEQRTMLDETATSQREALEDLRTQVRGFALELGERESELAHAEGTLAQVDRDQALARQELTTIEAEYRRRMVEAQRARDALEALAAQIRDELVELDEVSAETTVDEIAQRFGGGREEQGGEGSGGARGVPGDTQAIERVEPEEAARMRRQIDQLRGRMRQLGGYDANAPQEYEELKTRHEFLSGQVRDMEQGAANLRAIITELDTTMRRQFAETFAAVNVRFQRHFTTLFSGGSARLELTAPRRHGADENEEEDESSVAPPPRGPNFGGVEVFAQIPGKRVQDLALLSGGERAMVSAALLFALLETNPPPFCLLDEVDAALDEANVVRFCEILKQLATTTQFIVITHNRVTMTHAGAIYGVSMGPDSVSRVLSMRLADVPAAR